MSLDHNRNERRADTAKVWSDRDILAFLRAATAEDLTRTRVWEMLKVAKAERRKSIRSQTGESK